MSQSERMNSASNSWEADPWDASDEIADEQLAGFLMRAPKAVDWTSIRKAGLSVFGIERAKLVSGDVTFYATYDGEDMLLMQLDWHGFPDPPQWRLATRSSGSGGSWNSWGYFKDLPESWQLPLISSSSLDTILWKVQLLTDRPERVRGPETEVYYDARLAGEDGWELIEHLTERFQTDFSAMNIGEYIPHEGVDLRTLLVLLGKRPFKSLTIGRLVQAVETGKWQEDM